MLTKVFQKVIKWTDAANINKYSFQKNIEYFDIDGVNHVFEKIV